MSAGPAFADEQADRRRRERDVLHLARAATATTVVIAATFLAEAGEALVLAELDGLVISIDSRRNRLVEAVRHRDSQLIQLVQRGSRVEVRVFLTHCGSAARSRSGDDFRVRQAGAVADGLARAIVSMVDEEAHREDDEDEEQERDAAADPAADLTVVASPVVAAVDERILFVYARDNHCQLR
jgi:chromosome condensin MukBEF MukE localization factor